MNFVAHDHEMVSPDFDYEKMHPNDEPFWMVFSPYAADVGDPFLLDRAGAHALIKQLQNGLRQYYEKHPRQPNETPPDQMTPGGPKEAA